MEREYYVYILTNRPRGTLYVGVTNDLVRRMHEHRSCAVPGFTSKYRLKSLVHFEPCGEILVAMEREKQLKRWRRAWKLELIERNNPAWQDLYPFILE
jgi:putative endonuclease